MLSLAKRFPLAVLGGAALLGLAAPARAQIPYTPFDPYGNARRAAFNIALYGRAMQQVPPYALGYNPYPRVYAPRIPPVVPFPGGALYNNTLPAYGGGALVNNPYAGSPGTGYGNVLSDPYAGGYGGYGYNYDPYSGFLSGAASLVNAEGRFRIQNQEAKIVREKARQAALDTRRRAYDEWLYERANLPNNQTLREEYAKLDLRYHLTNPAPTEIYSAASLNVLLDNLQQLQAKGAKGTASVPLDEDLLKLVNVTSGSGGNIGLLKNDGRLTWPLALTGREFDESRKGLERNVPLAIREAENGRVDVGRQKDMRNDLERLSEALQKQIADLPNSQFIEARRYLDQMRDGLRALETADASNYFTGKYVARGKTVGELVKNMGGLRFAPAAPGEERAYRELYNALAAYYANVAGATAGGESRPAPERR